MDIAEQFAEAYLKKHALRSERFSSRQMRQSKTADFRVFKEEQLVLFCEAKHIEHDNWLDNQLKAALPGELVGGSRPDPIFNRVSNRIHEAVKQFKAVNADHSYPNVLVFANSDRQCDACDLRSVLTGKVRVQGGMDEPIYQQYSEGRIREEKLVIDLYIWWNCWEPAAKVARTLVDSRHRAVLVRLLPKDRQ